MEFIQLNYRKIITIFSLNVLIWTCISFFVLIIFRKNIENTKHINAYMMIFIVTMTMLWFSIFFIGGMYNFYKAKKIFSYIINNSFFDDEAYNIDLLYQKSYINFTEECLYGNIHQFPCVVIISQNFSKYAPTEIQFNICIIKFNRPSSETISFPLNWKGKPSNGMKESLLKFIEQIDSKNYPKADLSKGLKNSGIIF